MSRCNFTVIPLKMTSVHRLRRKEELRTLLMDKGEMFTRPGTLINTGYLTYTSISYSKGSTL